MASLKNKKFKLTAEDIKPIAVGYGACIATDRIVVDGMKVRYMYRETPDNEYDSGWRFMSGDETDDYMNNSENHGAYDVNTVANFDSDIIDYLGSPIGSAFERESSDQAFRQSIPPTDS